MTIFQNNCHLFSVFPGPYLGFFVCGGKLGFREISDQYSYKKQPSKIRHYVRKKTFSFPGGGNCPLRPPAMYGPAFIKSFYVIANIFLEANKVQAFKFLNQQFVSLKGVGGLTNCPQTSVKFSHFAGSKPQIFVQFSIHHCQNYQITDSKAFFPAVLLDFYLCFINIFYLIRTQ